MGLSGSRTEPYQNTQGPSGQGATSSPSPKTAIRQHGRGTRRLPGSARTADCQQFLAQRRSHQNTSRTYPSRGDRDSAQTKRLKGRARTILLQVKYIPPRLAGLARSRAPQDKGRWSGNIANCDQRTFQALPASGKKPASDGAGGRSHWGNIGKMIYTCYEMVRDCRAGLPEGWTHFISHYVPVIRKALAHHAPERAGDAALLDHILLTVRQPESFLFQSTAPPEERWF